MSNLLSNLLNNAYSSKNGYASINISDPTCLLNGIEIGTGSGYHACTDEHGRKVEVWLHLNRIINADECEEFRTIVSANDIPEDDYFI